MLLAARNLYHAADYTRGLVAEQELTGAELDKQVEAGKKQFAGYELPGKTLGVIGLGAIGVLVANAAQSLGLKVLGYDPAITVERAWQLSPNVEQVTSVEELFARSDMITLHVPLVEATKGLVDADRIASDGGPAAWCSTRPRRRRGRAGGAGRARRGAPARLRQRLPLRGRLGAPEGHRAPPPGRVHR
ncbi:hypothetical protein BJF82_15705 [Kytococcus sp. CUA-901]|nr:hypothetical protein BJF82_15705 [Kytococcus sp. CUA-901]